jgi:hypothetical protein
MSRMCNGMLSRECTEFFSMLPISLMRLLVFAIPCLLQTIHANVVVTGNPHMPSPQVCDSTRTMSSASCSRVMFIDPSRVIAAPAPVQADTFLQVHRVRYLDSVVPVSVPAPDARCCPSRASSELNFASQVPLPPAQAPVPFAAAI